MRKSVLALCLLTAVTATANAAPPADGLIDTNWGLFNSGTSIVAFDDDPSNPVDVAYAAVPDSQGRTYLVGTVGGSEADRIGITRLLRNGTIDLSYGDDGKVIFADQIVGVAAALDADGDLLVGASYVGVGDNTNFLVCRFDADGNPVAFTGIGDDEPCVTLAFDIGGENKDTLRDIAVQEDGKIVVAGDAESSTSLVKGAVARLNADGSLDTSFGSAGKQLILPAGFTSHRFNAVTIAPNGNIVLAGDSVATGKTDRDGLMVRLTPDGLLDPHFGSGNGEATYATTDGSNNQFYDLALIPALGDDPNLDNVIYAVGSSETGPQSRRYDGWITRINNSGTVDSVFGINGSIFPNPGETLSIRSVFLQADGKLVVAGSGSEVALADTDFYALRVKPSGVLDTGFNAPSGIIAVDTASNDHNDTAYAMAVLPDRFIIAGSLGSGSNPTNLDYVGAALTRDRIFTNSFEK